MEFKWIVREVADLYEVHPKEILGRSRVHPIAEARQVAMIIVMRRLGNQSAAGRRFNRDHGTVHHAVKTIGGLVRAKNKKVVARWKKVRHLAIPQNYTNVIDYQI